MRKKIKENKKKERKVKKKIKKDDDESSYNLEDFDQEISEYKNTSTELLEKKKNALKEFEDQTAKEIDRQVRETHEEKLNSLKAQYQEVHQAEKENLEKLNELSLKLSTDYRSILGNEYLEVESLDEMKKAIEDGQAKNISEAIDYLNEKN